MDPSDSSRDIFGNSVLHTETIAGKKANIGLIKQLLAEDPTRAANKNQFGRIPLHYAVDIAKPNFEVVTILLKSFPSGVSCKNTDGETPYDIGA